ncbi:MAG TPA: lysophospholipid acyltransferase family protein [Polyangiaceae bacterium]|nr:lysophospholipid acyltransferase family protein [Polyangiaceae bacterium]
MLLSTALDPSSLFFRRLAYAGARYGPRFWVQYSPAVFGAAFAMLLPEQRQRVKENLRLVYGQRSRLEEDRDVLRTFAAYASCLAEALGADRADARAASIRSEGEEHLGRALAAGRGVVIVTAHAGAWDCAGRFLASRFNAPVMVVMEAEADDRARALQDQVRRSGGVDVLIVGNDQLSALPLLRHLKAGGVAAFQLDRTAPSGRALEVELFGRSFAVPEGPFRIAAMSGAAVLPLFVRRAGYFDYELKVHPGLSLPRRPSKADLLQAASRSARAMEDFIRDNPTQWFHFHAARRAG